MTDELGDRMKIFEGMESNRRLMPCLPALARIDGRAFHSFTRDMDRPYDQRLSKCMIETTKRLVTETGAEMGYTQSDEISLAFWSADPKSQIFFDGRIMKMTSQLAALATLYFHQQLPRHHLGQYVAREPTFDARVWNVPSSSWAADYFGWREQDATRNSISMAAQSMFSHKELQNKGCSEMQEMMFSQGQNWNDFPVFFKRGMYVQRRKVFRKFTPSEIVQLAPLHEARKDPNLVIERSEVAVMDMPPIASLANASNVIFFGIEPVPLIRVP